MRILLPTTLALATSIVLLGAVPTSSEDARGKYFLSIFAMNMHTFETVVIKDCVEYRPKTEETIEGYVSEFEKAGMACEKNKGSKSWACNDQVSRIVKLTLNTDLNECKSFPREFAGKIKKIMGK